MGYDEQYESWRLGVTFQDHTRLVVSCPGDEIAGWCPNLFNLDETE